MGIDIWGLLILVALFATPGVVLGPVVKKAGFSWWWSLILLVPVINVVMVWRFAFMEWPAEKNA
jgi:membrane protein DedA with SNARE-associated domain